MGDKLQFIVFTDNLGSSGVTEYETSTAIEYWYYVVGGNFSWFIENCKFHCLWHFITKIMILIFHIVTKIHLVLYMGNIWQGKILVNHTGKSYWWGKIWWISYSQWICHIHFLRMCEYWWGKFWQMAHNSPNSPTFSLPKFSRVRYITTDVNTILLCTTQLVCTATV